MSIFDGNVLCIMEIVEFPGIERVTVDTRTQPRLQLDGSSQLAFHFHHLKLKAQGWQFTKHRAHLYSRLATHKRLFRRLRRHTPLGNHTSLLFTKHHALTILRNLIKHTSASFEAAKQLSGRRTDLEVYAIRRMATR